MASHCHICGCELPVDDRLPWHNSRGAQIGTVHAGCALRVSIARQRVWLDLRERILSIATGQAS